MASVKVKVDGKMISKSLQKKFAKVHDPKTMLAIHNTLARYCDPYVPYNSGILSQTITVLPNCVKYTQPYARYQYYGEVYGPNIPIIRDGIVVGWFSPPGQKKHPTGEKINYSKEGHPLATSFWDKVMIRDKRKQFNGEIKDIIVRRLSEVNGGR